MESRRPSESSKSSEIRKAKQLPKLRSLSPERKETSLTSSERKEVRPISSPERKYGAIEDENSTKILIKEEIKEEIESTLVALKRAEEAFKRSQRSTKMDLETTSTDREGVGVGTSHNDATLPSFESFSLEHVPVSRDILLQNECGLDDSDLAKGYCDNFKKLQKIAEEAEKYPFLKELHAFCNVKCKEFSVQYNRVRTLGDLTNTLNDLNFCIEDTKRAIQSRINYDIEKTSENYRLKNKEIERMEEMSGLIKNDNDEITRLLARADLVRGYKSFVEEAQSFVDETGERRDHYQSEDVIPENVKQAYRVYMLSRAWGREVKGKSEASKEDLDFGVVGRYPRDGGAFSTIDSELVSNLLGDNQIMENIKIMLKLEQGKWSLLCNDAWELGLIHSNCPVKLATPINEAAVWNNKPGRNCYAVFAREVAFLTFSGYTESITRPGFESELECSNPEKARSASLSTCRDAVKKLQTLPNAQKVRDVLHMWLAGMTEVPMKD